VFNRKKQFLIKIAFTKGLPLLSLAQKGCFSWHIIVQTIATTARPP